MRASAARSISRVKGITKDAIRRGDVALDPELHAPADRIDARMRVCQPRQSRSASGSLSGFIMPRRKAVRASSCSTINRSLPGEEADVQLVLDRPIAAAAHDRFVIRDVSAQRTLGGGEFLDLRAKARGRRTPERREQRAALALADQSASFAALL